MTTTTTIRSAALCRPFACEKARVYDVLVEGNVVLVWDSVAGHYTSCHQLSKRSQARIAKQARSFVA
jgi:hypothetical protein